MPAKRPRPASRRYSTVVLADPDGSTMTVLPVPFDPKAVFGRGRAPVVVGLPGYSFRSTVFVMGGERFVPLRASHREAAGLRAGQRVRVTLTLDTAERRVTPPPELAGALARASAAVRAAWEALSFTHQREHAEAIADAKKPETRARRVAACLTMLRGPRARAGVTSAAARRT